MARQSKKADKESHAKAAVRRALSGDELLDMLCDAAEQRDARNGFTEAMEILNVVLPKAFAKADGPTSAKVKRRILDIYSPMLDDDDFTESVMDDAIKAIYDSGGMIDIVEEAIAYCAFAVRAYFNGDDTVSWSYACDARHWSGVVTMVAKRREMPKPGALLARIRHQQTRKEHEKVAGYWRANIDAKLSAQKAANAVLQAEVTSLSHKKIAEIISALRKAELVRKK